MCTHHCLTLFVIFSKLSQCKDDRPYDHSSSRDERKRQHSPPPSSSSRHSSQPASKMGRNHNEEKKKHPSHAKHDSKKDKRRAKVNSREQCWMASGLRVRIIDQDYQRGKYYNNKVLKNTCLCKCDC